MSLFRDNNSKDRIVEVDPYQHTDKTNTKYNNRKKYLTAEDFEPLQQNRLAVK